MDQTTLVQSVVEEVLLRMDGGNGQGATSISAVGQGTFGLFDNVDQAVVAARRSQAQLMDGGVETRDQICNLIKRIVTEKAQEWGRLEMEETKIGRLDHKILKCELLHMIPGVEYLRTIAHSGDAGISLDEFAPWGVLGIITPVTHSIPTLTCNAINMIAAGNAIVCNAHPGGAKCAAHAAEVYNRAIAEQFGIENLICLINPPSLRSAEEIFRHPDIALLVVTGGPGVARAAMKQSKRAIVAGPGNPPVVVDETADFDNAAKSIVLGASFDNELMCIGEKEVFVVERVFDKMMSAMPGANASLLNSAQIAKLTDTVFEKAKDGHLALKREYVGADCHVLAEVAGTSCAQSIDLLYGETEADHPMVFEEQMLPFVPFVRARDVDHAIELAIKYEHGFGHTALIHSNDMRTITKMGRAMNTTIFVANGPSTAGVGGGGEGHPSYSIATPTGEGITSPMTFTRFRRMSVSRSLRMI